MKAKLLILCAFCLLASFYFVWRIVAGHDLNSHVISVITNYPQNGQPPVDWRISPADYGVTRIVSYAGRTVAKPNADRSTHCSGLTFDVFMAACERAEGRNFRLRRISASNVDLFRRDWYGVDGNEKTMVAALASRELGQVVLRPSEARKGDFVQFWRNNGTGHSVVFLGWIRNSEGLIAGLSYWSVGADGIGSYDEYVGPNGFEIDAERIHIVRAYRP